MADNNELDFEEEQVTENQEPKVTVIQPNNNEVNEPVDEPVDESVDENGQIDEDEQTNKVEEPVVPKRNVEAPVKTDEKIVINGSLMESQAKQAFELLGGDPETVDTWEEIRDTLQEYARVYWHVSKPMNLELLCDKIIKSNGFTSSVVTYDTEIADNRTNILPLTISASATKYEYRNEDIVLSGDTHITNKKTPVIGKSVELKEMVLDSGSMQLEAVSGDIRLTNITSQGNVNRSSSGNAAFSINTNQNVKVSGCAFNSTGYNCLEIGLSTNYAPKKIVIENCNFEGTCSNNAISIFAQADGAEILVKDCHFKKVSNALRISNRTNTSATYKFVNCTFDEWEANPEYAGAIICQDYTFKPVSASNEANLFSQEKIKIEFVNCTHAGKKIKAANAAACSATKNVETQLIYVYRDADSKVLPFDENMYPALSFK